MDDRPDKIINCWVEGVNAKDLEAVLSMYDESAILLPTFSSEIRCNLDGIQRYFMKLAQSERIEVSIDKNSKFVQHITDTIYSIGGLYTWDIQHAGERKSFVARYTFTMNVAADRPILHHHSSLLPET